MPISYPRPCSICGTKINNRGNFSRHKKHCGTNIKVPCFQSNKVFSRKDALVKHVRKCHSKAVKRKADNTSELERLELLHSSKIPRMSVEQTGGAVTTRGTKRTLEEELKPDVKVSKNDQEDMSDERVSDSQPLFIANVKKLGPAKRWKSSAVVNQKFIMTLDQQRGPNEGEDLNVEATFAIADATDKLIDELNISDDYWMTLQICSKEHRRDGLTGETWKVPVGNFTKRAAMTQAVLQKLAHVLNSGEFITNDVGFSASVLFSRPERKGGKSKTPKPGEKTWEQMAKESKSVCEIKNKDDLYCGRAIVVMQEYAKRQAGVENTFKNIYLDRGKNSQH